LQTPNDPIGFGNHLLHYGSWTSGSVSLLADAIDFFGDAGNYAISLAVLGMAAATRSKAALFKAACIGAFGVFVLGKSMLNLQTGIPPEPTTMGVIGFVALAVNGGVALHRPRPTERQRPHYTRDEQVRPGAPGSNDAQRGQHDREVAERVDRCTSKPAHHSRSSR
jgi:hypothetical protein